MKPTIVTDSLYGRVYEVSEGVYFPSVTTITSYGTPMAFGILEYIIKQSQGNYLHYLNNESEATMVGTKAHDIVEQLILGKKVDLSGPPSNHFSGGIQSTWKMLDQLKKAVISFVEFWNHYNPHMCAVEKLLYSLRMMRNKYVHPFCGRADFIGTIDGDLWMLDWKTGASASKDPRVGLQLSMYKMLWDSIEDRPIDRLGVVSLKKDFKRTPNGKTLLSEFKYDPSGVKVAYDMFTRFYTGYDLNGRVKTKKPLPTTFKLEQDEKRLQIPV